MLTLMGIAYRLLTPLLLGTLAPLGNAPLQAQTPPSVAAPAAAPTPVPTPGAAPQAPTPAAPPASAMLSKFSPLADTVDWGALAATCSKVLTAQEFDMAYGTYFSDGRQLPAPWAKGTDTLDVSTGLISPAIQNIKFCQSMEKPAEVQKYWRKAVELSPAAGRPLLADLRIAIDPGHIGGGYAQMEERFLSFKGGERVMEGESSLQVAKLLKEKLEAEGAQVFLIRETEDPVTTTRPADYRELALKILADLGVPQPVEAYAGLEGPAKVLTLQWQAEKLFYRVSEIRARAKKVNELLKPDLVLCLHFNAEAWGSATQPQYSPVNHFHILVNGCYAPDELQFQDIRYEMLQRLFSRVIDEELPLAEELAKAVASLTQLPPYNYTQGNARRVGSTPFVYARNLLANRLYRCPTIYLEPYVMNNQETYNRMLHGPYVGRTLVNGRLTRSIIDDYAEGVAQGLINHYRTKRRS